jgi:SHS2 domain-containing protein
VRAASGHRAVEHTADLAFELWAPDEAGLLREALRALVEALTEGAAVRPEAERALSLDAIDPEDRLVRFCNELLYLATVHGFVAADADLRLVDGGLEARLRGQEGARALLRAEIKAATYHDLRIQRRPGEVRARLVLDV